MVRRKACGNARSALPDRASASRWMPAWLSIRHGRLAEGCGGRAVEAIWPASHPLHAGGTGSMCARACHPPARRTFDPRRRAVRKRRSGVGCQIPQEINDLGRWKAVDGPGRRLDNRPGPAKRSASAVLAASAPPQRGWRGAALRPGGRPPAGPSSPSQARLGRRSRPRRSGLAKGTATTRPTPIVPKRRFAARPLSKPDEFRICSRMAIRRDSRPRVSAWRSEAPGWLWVVVCSTCGHRGPLPLKLILRRFGELCAQESALMSLRCMGCGELGRCQAGHVRLCDTSCPKGHG